MNHVTPPLKKLFLERLNNGIENTFADGYVSYLAEHDALNVRSSLDVGAGRGVFVRKLRRLGIDAYGVERESEKVETAVVSTIECGAFTTAYESPRRYDLISLTQVIYFVGPVPEVLAHLKSLLNPGGLVFIITSTQNMDRHREQHPTHEFPSREQYYSYAQKLGYKILDFTIFQSNLGVAFNDGMWRGLLRILAFQCGLSKPNIEDSEGNHTYILLRLL